jgi:hypothetical protein
MEDHWQVSVETLERTVIEPIKSAKHFDAVQALGRQLMWQDFGHRGDWQSPAPLSAISSKSGWEVGILRTLLADDVCMLARKAPQGDEFCLEANHFGTCLLHEEDRPLVRAVSGRVLLVKIEEDESLDEGGLHSKSFLSYAIADFASHLKNVDKEVLAGVCFRFPCYEKVEFIPGILPLCSLEPVIHEATYVRLSCTRSANGWILLVEPYKRASQIAINTPCSFRDMRQQLAEKMLWCDFGHDSDWRNPSSRSKICAKSGWEVGLLETKLGSDICMLARKPAGGEERLIPFNHFATQLMHDSHRPMIRFVNGCVLLARAGKDLAAINHRDSERGSFAFQSLHVDEFCDAYHSLSSEMRFGISLLTPGHDDTSHADDSATSVDSHAMGQSSDSIKLVGGETFVTPMFSTAAQADLDGWEWVDAANVVDAGSCKDASSIPVPRTPDEDLAASFVLAQSS